MKYLVDVNGERVEVALEEGGVRLGEDQWSTHLEQVDGTPVHLVRIGGAVHRVVVARGMERGRYTLWIGARRFDVDAVDERTGAIRELTGGAGGAQGPRPLVAPMPGLIVRLHVAIGDAVAAGQPLVSMEAMKMENELRSSTSGTVRAIAVAPGDAVPKGALLVELA